MEVILRFEHVCKRFGDDVALDDVTFSIPEGDTRIVFGAAGSGKSVMLKTAVGLVRPDSGHVWLFGEDITQMKEERLFGLRSRVGILFQEGGLFDSLTVRENVEYPLLNQQRLGEEQLRLSPEEIDRRVREALRFVELEHTLDKYPSELSGGMRRRVGIARATVTQPRLVLYDSPTAGLDPITANTIIALIIKARDLQKTTSILVTHRYQDGHLLANYRYNQEKGQLEPAPRDTGIHERTLFMVFRKGRLIFEGTQEELEAARDPYLSKFKMARPA
jgi:phospholipid/cholesterol/gamma-HCH transport system ATP-binding protein